jgi:hypothetical protein
MFNATQVQPTKQFSYANAFKNARKEVSVPPIPVPKAPTTIVKIVVPTKPPGKVTYVHGHPKPRSCKQGASRQLAGMPVRARMDEETDEKQEAPKMTKEETVRAKREVRFQKRLCEQSEQSSCFGVHGYYVQAGIA